VDVAMLASTFSGSVYLVFMAETLMGFMNHVFHIEGSERIYILIITIPVFLMAQVRELKHIAPFSLCANIFLFSAFGITLYYVFSGTISLADKPLIVSVDKWPFAMR
jgi:proton-coupled amino acid transporter